MFEEWVKKVAVCVRSEISLNESEEVRVYQVLESIYFDGQHCLEGQVFYFDYLKNDFVKIAQGTQTSASNVIRQNQIIIRFHPKMSDEILANPFNTNTILKIKRSGERHIKEAFSLVQTWRRLYMFGNQNQNGQIKKYNLDQSAEQVGIPRKSLQDYFLLLRMGKQFGFNYTKHQNDKMGVLRKFVKSIPKKFKEREKFPLKQESKQKIRSLENIFFRQIARQLQSEQIGEENIYQVLEIQSSRSVSDEDIVQYEN